MSFDADWWTRYVYITSGTFVGLTLIGSAILYKRQHLWPIRARSMPVLWLLVLGCVLASLGANVPLLQWLVPRNNIELNRWRHNWVTWLTFLPVFTIAGNIYLLRLFIVLWQNSSMARITRATEAAMSNRVEGTLERRAPAGGNSKRLSGGERMKKRIAAHPAATLLIIFVCETAFFMLLPWLLDPDNFVSDTGSLMPAYVSGGLWAVYIALCLTIAIKLKLAKVSDATGVVIETYAGAAGASCAVFAQFVLLFVTDDYPARMTTSLLFWACIAASVYYPVWLSLPFVQSRSLAAQRAKKLRMMEAADKKLQKEKKRKEARLAAEKTKTTKRKKRGGESTETTQLRASSSASPRKHSSESGSSDGKTLLAERLQVALSMAERSTNAADTPRQGGQLLSPGRPRSMSMSSGASSEHMHLQFEHVLDDPELLRALQTYVVSLLSAHYLLFLIDYRMFEACSTSEAERQARHLYSAYLDSDTSELGVLPISEEQRRTVRARLLAWSVSKEEAWRHVHTIRTALESPSDGIARRAHAVGFKKVKDCFTGAELLGWLVDKSYCLSREEAALYGNALVAAGLIAAARETKNWWKATVKDSSSCLYRLVEATDEIDVESDPAAARPAGHPAKSIYRDIAEMAKARMDGTILPHFAESAEFLEWFKAKAELDEEMMIDEDVTSGSTGTEGSKHQSPYAKVGVIEEVEHEYDDLPSEMKTKDNGYSVAPVGMDEEEAERLSGGSPKRSARSPRSKSGSSRSQRSAVGTPRKRKKAKTPRSNSSSQKIPKV